MVCGWSFSVLGFPHSLFFVSRAIPIPLSTLGKAESNSAGELHPHALTKLHLSPPVIGPLSSNLKKLHRLPTNLSQTKLI